MIIRKIIQNPHTADERIWTLGDGLNVLFAPDAAARKAWYAAVRAAMSGGDAADICVESEGAEELERMKTRRTELTAEIQKARSVLRKNALSSMGEARKQTVAAEEACRNARDALRRAEEALDATPYGRMGEQEASRRSDIDRRNAEELLRLAEKLPPVRWAYVPLGLAVAAFIAAMLLPWKAECAVAGCVFVLLFAILYTRLLSMRKTKQETLAARQRILDAYGVETPEEIEALLSDYRVLWKEKERMAYRLEQAEETLEATTSAQGRMRERLVDDLDFAAGDNEAVNLTRERDAIAEEIGRKTPLLAEVADDDSAEMLEKLRNGAGTRQVILFTDDETICGRVEKDAAATIIKL